MPDNDVTFATSLLSYQISAADKAHFLRFVEEGEIEDGNFVVDPLTGLEMTGVIAWLRGEGLFNTKFYTVDRPDGSLLFIATEDPPPQGMALADWSRIPGFQRQFGPNNRMTLRDDLNALIAPPPQSQAWDEA